MIRSRSRSSSLWNAFSVFVALAMVIALGLGSPKPSPAAAAQPADVDPFIYAVMEREGKARVMLVFKEQADLSGASSLDTKAEKGQFVYDRLVQTARHTQTSLKSFLTDRKLDFKSYWIQNMIILDVDSALLKVLSKRPELSRIEYLYPVYPDPVKELPTYGPSPILAEAGPEAIEWNITRVGAPDAWALGVDGTGTVIGDLDTGVQWNHPALINQYRGNLGGGVYNHNYNWYDGGMTTVPTDYDTHGTHTMGTIVGDDGGSNQIGVAPGAKWIACPGIGSPYVGPFECFQFFIAPTDVYGDNPDPTLAPDVINNSWSSAGTDFHTAIQALTAAGIFFAKSAGNTGGGCGTITNPGQWPEVTAAAAFAQGDNIASFSSRGPVFIGYDAFVKPDIAAPGVAIRSAMPGDGYQQMQGTSMASPHIAGAVALLVSANPELAGKVDILQMLLKKTAEPKTSSQCEPFIDIPNDVWGYGILDVEAAVIAAQGIHLGTLEGTVIDAVTSDLVPGAALTFEDADGWKITDQSLVDGSFSHVLNAGTYTVHASAYGYLPETVSGVVVTDGGTTNITISMDLAPTWTVSGLVQENGAYLPLVADIKFSGSSVTTASDPVTGAYSVEIAQGTYWMDVYAPGHTRQVRQVTVTEDHTEDFLMMPIDNYYMRTADSPCSPPTFDWKDATGGTVRNLSDDASVSVNLPAGRTFFFYGQSYTSIWIVSNGIAVFGTNNTKWSGPIPDPATPNNGIYAFSTDLNPASGSQGTIYTAYLEERYFVIQWNAVQHYPSGNPETFEIVLDFDTGKITLQYLVVSNPADAVAGVENAAGDEATQYAYAALDPELFANGVAVDFYPMFGTPPLDAAATVSGMLYDDITNDPILVNGLVTAVNGTSVFTTTTTAGSYTLSLCPATYDFSASAVNYAPSPVVSIPVSGGESLPLDFYLLPNLLKIFIPSLSK